MTELTYKEKAKRVKNSVAKKLLLLMEEKKSNLCFNPDVTTKDEFLNLVDKVGPYICLLKTHIDIIEDFDKNLVDQLVELAKKHNFMIFEDRKFADIGNTAKMQFQKGVYAISSWADIVNAHTIVGPGLIEGLLAGSRETPQKDHGLLLLAQMSSQDNLLDPSYTQKTLDIAKIYPEFVMGFIAMERLSDDMITLTPGVKLQRGKDSFGQQYQTVSDVIKDKKSDIIIVGRGIYKAANPASEAQKYQETSWQSYQERLVDYASSSHCS